MYNLKKEGIILDVTGLEFENEGVLDPAIMQEVITVYVFYRAVRKGNHSTIGYAKLDVAGINFDFHNSDKLADAALLMLSAPNMMDEMHMNALHIISPTIWQN